MCYAIPAKVEEINGRMVTISYFGERARAINETAGLAVGDYVYCQGGYIISRLEAEEAGRSLEGWEELFFQMREADSAQAQRGLARKGASLGVQALLEKSLAGGSLSDAELLSLLQPGDGQDRQALHHTANALRQKYHKNSCCVHGILEISNHCRRECAYCGISCTSQVPRYRMGIQEILAAAGEAIEGHGFKSLVLQSGEGAYSNEELVRIVKAIKERYAVLLFISFGEVGIEGLRSLYEAGARGLLMRFETSNPALYARLHPGSSLDTRISHLRAAYGMGYLIITGSVVGLPGQGKEDLVNDVKLACGLHAEMLSFGPFLAHPATPMAGMPAPSAEEMLDLLSVARLAAPRDAKVLVTTAFETLSASAREQGLLSGANSMMLNATPLRYRPLYSIYPHRAHEGETLDAQIQEALALLKSLGRGPSDLGISGGNAPLF